MKAENKKTRKKFRLGTLVRALAALVLVTAMTLSLFMTTGTAEFVKSLSAKLDFAATPSTPYVAYLKDDNNTSVASLYYNNADSISQSIKLNSSVTAENAIYQIKLPVTDAGLYNISFTVRIDGGNGYVPADCWSAPDAAKPSVTLTANKVSLNKAVGCKVDTSLAIDKDNPFAPLSIERTRLSTVQSTQVGYLECPVYGPNVNNNSGYHDYQWKTLAPARSENVTLTFNLESGKAAFWTWDLRGLTTATTYTINLTNISIEKIAEPEGPYLNFSNSHYVNNALIPTPHTDNDDYSASLFYPMDWPRVKNSNGTMGNAAGVRDSHEIRGRVEAGKTRTSIGRGTYLTEADYDGMTMQAETLVYGYMRYDATEGDANSFDTLVDPTFVNEKGWYGHERYSNLVSFGIPIENVERGKTYKVTYDLGFARQGSMDVENGYESQDYINYAEYADILAKKKDIGSLHFESYLYAGTEHEDLNGGKGGTDDGRSQAFCIPMVTHDTFGRGNVPDSNKALFGSTKGQYLTRYNELWNIGTGTVGNCYMSYVDSVNDSQNLSREAFLNQTDKKYNWYNAVQHTEYNGQNKINWITFTNSTFTFTVEDDTDINQLHWTWAIDGLEKKSWYRIKFDNVRIEEVVSYGSNVENNGLTFNGVNAGFATYEDIGLFRGANGTGQNGQARAFSGGVPLANMNLYAPIFDAASKVAIADDGNQRIGLRGYAVCKGGVEKYVWSADGGVTWYDMETQYLSNITDEDLLNTAESHAENSTIGLLGKQPNDSNGDEAVYSSSSWKCEHANYTDADGKNAQYDIVANLKGTPYENAFGLDIIFAAVPSSNTNLRCEIMRVTNYNAIANYRTYTLEIESDITVKTEGNYLSATWSKGPLQATDAENSSDFQRIFGITCGNTPSSTSSTGGYARRLDSFDSYEDMRTIYQNVPVKNKLKIRGWAVVQGGVEAYYWSADHGKTWTKCEGSWGDVGPTGSDALTSQRASWYDGVSGDDAPLKTNSHFSLVSDGLIADLSDYVGRTVDVIFAAKSNYNRTYCPVGRIDNVAVYGDPDLGNYGSGVRGAGPGPFYVHYDLKDGAGNDICKVYDQNNDFLSRIPFESSLVSGWTNAVNSNQLTSMEVYNATFGSMRAYNKTPVEVKAGYSIAPYGWMICHGGVAYYKYSFDGGKNWTVIKTGNDNYLLETPGNTEAQTMVGHAAAVDSTFKSSVDNAKGGGFRYTFSNAFTQEVITSPPLKVPSDITGRCNLQVVAVSNKGYTYPVVSIALNITSQAYTANWEQLYNSGKLRSQWYNDASDAQNKYETCFTVTASENSLNSTPIGNGENLSYYSTDMFTVSDTTSYEYYFEAKNNRQGGWAGAVFAYDPSATIPYFVHGQFDNNSNEADSRFYFRKGHNQITESRPAEDIVLLSDIKGINVKLNSDGFGSYKMVYSGYSATLYYLATDGTYKSLGTVTLPSGAKICLGVYSAGGNEAEQCTLNIRNSVLVAYNDEAKTNLSSPVNPLA